MAKVKENMLDYDLVEQLKNADFVFRDNPTSYVLDFILNREPLPLPALEELIRACGVEFGSLVRIDADLWRAVAANSSLEAEAPDPDEAVARFWLALQDAYMV
jgi:hypothetical protein